MTSARSPRRWPRIVLVAAAGLFVVLGIVSAMFGPRLSQLARTRAIAALEEGLDSKADIEELSVSVWPRLSVKGRGLVVRHRGRTDVPPLVSIREFSAATGYFAIFESPRRVHVLDCTGLEIHIPPRPRKPGQQPATGAPVPRPREQPAPDDPDVTPSAPPRPAKFVIDRLDSADAILRILPRNADKRPKEFLIHRLEMSTVRLDRAMPFDAVLTNPLPRGEIHSDGSFGPWQSEEPGASPAKGKYTFDKADMSTIKGLGGTLSSVGDYDGTLGRIAVKGTTTTPDFSLDIGGTPVPLDTRFAAVVDGTNGDTFLESVDARLSTTPIHAVGRVVGSNEVRGKTVELAVTIDAGRIEDVLKLAMRGEPLMRGALTLDTSFLLPPGDVDVARKLRLDGRFGIESVRFQKGGVQQKVDTLSRRGQGIDKDEERELAGQLRSVTSDLDGRFVLRDGTITLSSVRFEVPGASVNLQGRYGLVSGALDFTGTLRMKARVSETQTGWKALLLRAVDPIFAKKGAGAVIPIRITGTREKPEFGMDTKRALKP